MPKMFKFGNYLLRESARQLDRDKNIAQIVFTLEPEFGTPVPYQRENPTKFYISIQKPSLWNMVKDAGANPVIEMIDAEVVRFRAEKENFIDSEGIPAPYPRFSPELIEYLVDKEYTIIVKE